MLALSIKQLKKVYANGLIALNNINLEVKKGDFFALLGQNGAGKSTTIGILSSLVLKTSGEVRIFGYDIDTHLEAAKACSGFVPQEINFNPFEKALDVIVNQAGYYGIPKQTALPRAQFYLEKLNLWERRHSPIIRLSGGMKRRLMIARALISNPSLLVLDEPTAGVDIELRHVLWDFLKELNEKGTTIILTTHYLEEAEQLCKNVAIIDHGELIQHADMKSLIGQLTTQTLILDLTHPIETLPLLPNHPYRMIDKMTMEVEIHKSFLINTLFESLTQQGLSVKSMRNKTNRLEELFVRLISENKAKYE